MNLWESKEFKGNEHFSTRRHVVRLDCDKYGVYLAVETQAWGKESKTWRELWTRVGISITRFWDWGSAHSWYDGPHCSFSVGPVHFVWEEILGRGNVPSVRSECGLLLASKRI